MKLIAIIMCLNLISPLNIQSHASNCSSFTLPSEKEQSVECDPDKSSEIIEKAHTYNYEQYFWQTPNSIEPIESTKVGYDSIG